MIAKLILVFLFTFSTIIILHFLGDEFFDDNSFKI